jgi:hypothetical protein
MSEGITKSITEGNTTMGEVASKPLIPRRYLVLGIILAVVFLLVVVALVVLGVRNPVHTETIRDLAIIALAVESTLIGVALVVLIIQVARLVNMLEFEIKPILSHTSDTVSTLRGTANFVSEHMVNPMIHVSGYASGLGRLASSIGGLFRSTKQAGPRKGGPTDKADGGER